MINKEIIKEFLRPSKNKMFLFLIFVIILVNTSTIGVQETGGSEEIYSYLELLLETHNDSWYYSCVGFFIIEIIILYLFSCLIIFVYNKFRN